jgi:glutamate dehydrogenase/leucine dehydrogenase
MRGCGDGFGKLSRISVFTAAAAAAAPHEHERRYMTDAYHQISKIAADHKVPLRVAAFLLAVKRVAQAEQHRGFD